MRKIQCTCCGKRLPEKDFWKHKADPPIWRGHADKEYYVSKCKNCYLSNVNLENMDTIFPILEEFNVPYLESIWKRYCEKWNYNILQILPRYLNLMRLCSFYEMQYKHSEYFDNLARQNEKRLKEYLNNEQV